MDQGDVAARFPQLFATAQELRRKRMDRFGRYINWESGADGATEDDVITTFDEALYVFNKTVGVFGGPAVPRKHLPEEAPWTVPEYVQDANTINELLMLSLMAQKTAIRGTEFWESGIMSGDYMTVCGVMHLHFKLSGIPSELKVGIRRVRCGGAGIPVVWLKIRGNMIDNTYYHSGDHLPGVFDDQIFQKNRAGHYEELDPSITSIRLVEGLGIRTCVNDPKVFKAYATPENIGQYLWFRNSLGHIYPSFKLFFSAYSDVAKLRFGSFSEGPLLDLGQLVGKWDSMCWHCRKSSGKLRKCSMCRVAAYCDGRCQSADWPLHKLLHSDMKANDEFWRHA